MNTRPFFKLILSLVLVTSGGMLYAQYEDDQTGYDNYYDTDTGTGTEAQGDYNYDNYDYSQYSDQPEENKKPEKKPYVRIEMPYDTIMELITYTGIVEQEESFYDSLYYRAMKYMIKKYNLSEKDFKESKVELNKIIMTVNVPFKIQVNKFVTTENGTLQFELAFWFKDGKYKYEIDHLKHIMPANAAGASGLEYIYLEYYMRSERNIVGNDKLLRAADAQVSTMINEFKKALREPASREDEWDF